MTWRPLADENANDPRPVGISLDRLARSMGIADSRRLQAVFGDWEQIVGKSVASHCEPVTLDNEILVVKVDHPTWATQLRLLGPQILDRLADKAGVRVASEINFKIAPSKLSSTRKSSRGSQIGTIL